MNQNAQESRRSASGSHRVGKAHGVGKVCRSFRKRRRGAAAVEFAIIAPLFFVLVFGMIEFGRMVMVQQILTNASREGARRAILEGATAAEVSTLVTTYLSDASVSGATVTVAPSPISSAAFGDPVTVSVSVPYGQVSWVPAPMFLGSTTMNSSVVMRRERVD